MKGNPRLSVLLSAAAACLLAAGPLRAGEPLRTRVSVTSQPSGATVVIDGRDRGTTPITLFDLTPGRHHLKYRLAGYVERDRFFNTDEGPTIERNEVLEEEKGLFLLKSDPSGCDVQVDGVSVGRTPCLLTQLSAKDAYAVKLRKAGYLEQTFTLRFDGRRPLVREERLVLASGTISIQTDPPGAEITVNGVPKGKSPVTVAEVPKGRATVKFHLEGFADEVRELSVNAGDVQNLPIVLKALPGTLHLVSVPEGARFYVNDEAHGKGPLTLTGLKPGEYRVRAELAGHGTVSKTLRLGNGESLREEFRLGSVMGRLEVRTTPPGAQLVFDGRPVGVTKATDPNAAASDVFALDGILEGEHTLVVRKDGFAEATRHPKVRNSKTSKANVTLRRIFTPDVELVTARGVYRGVLVSNTPQNVVIEVKLGITQSFPKDEIRKLTFLKP